MNKEPDFEEASDPQKIPQSPLVSVVMLAYRHESYIVQAVEGITSQAIDFPIEIIIGEDRSPDRTLEVALDCQLRYPEHVRVLSGKKNIGAHLNFLRCVQAARGKYIALCEADDYWHHPQKLKMQLTTLQANVQLAACHTDYDRLIGRRRKRSGHASAGSKWIAQGDAYEHLLCEHTVITATVLYRTEIVRAFVASEFNRASWPFGDYNLALYASTQGHFAYLPISTATWRKVAGSATNSGFANILKMILAEIECKELFISRHPTIGEVHDTAMQLAYRRALPAAFLAGDIPQYKLIAKRLAAVSGGVNFCNYHLNLLAMKIKAPPAVLRSIKRLILWASTSL